MKGILAILVLFVFVFAACASAPVGDAKRIILEQDAKVKEPRTTTTPSSVTAEMPIGDGLHEHFGIDGALNGKTISGLKAFYLPIHNNEYLVQEKIYLANDNNDFGVQTAITMTAASLLTINSYESRDMGADVVVPIKHSDLRYCYEFQQNLRPQDYITTATYEDPVTLKNFLGRDYKVLGATDTSMVLRLGNEVTLHAGESYATAGKVATLLRTTSGTCTGGIVENNIQLKVNDVLYNISGEDPLTHGNLTILVINTFDDEGYEFDSIALNVNYSYYNSTDVLLDYLESFEIEGNVIQFLGLDTTIIEEPFCVGGAAIIEVDGQTEAVDEGDTEEINGLTVSVVDVRNEDGIEFDEADLVLGELTDVAYGNGDEFIGEPNDDENVWAWELIELNTPKPRICAKWVLDALEPGDVDENSQGIDRPLYPGDEYKLPLNYARVSFDSVFEDAENTSLLVEPAIETLYTFEGNIVEMNAPVLKIAPYFGLDSLLACGGPTKNVYLYSIDSNNIGVYYQQNESNDVVQCQNITSGELAFQILTDSRIMDVVYEDSYLNFEFLADDVLKLKIVADSFGDFSFLGGGLDNVNTSNDLVWTNGLQDIDLFPRAADARTAYGVVVFNPNYFMGTDRLYFMIPQQPVKATISISGQTTTSPPVVPPKEDPIPRDVTIG